MQQAYQNQSYVFKAMKHLSEQHKNDEPNWLNAMPQTYEFDETLFPMERVKAAIAYSRECLNRSKMH
jgi:hypothetical protein